MKLRAYQQSIYDQIVAAETDDLVQLDTGAGKTPIIAALARHYGRAVIVCHRNVLVKQASKMLAANGITHAVTASKQTVSICALNNRRHFERDFINPEADISVVSIDTWHSHFKRGKLEKARNGVLIIDEAHHLADNKWNRIREVLGCRCIGLTATPCRGDGFPLIKQYGGFFDRIVQAEGYRENGTERLIAEGYLSPYRAYFCKEIGQKNSADDVLSIGETALRTYKERAAGNQAIIVYPRIKNAQFALAGFVRSNIRAVVIHGLMPQYEIQRALEAFEDKRVQVLIAVDIVNEGFDVPDAEVLILARDVRSFGLYRQLCGRVLRPAPGKTALIFDLTGESITRHGLPSDPVDWNKRQGMISRRDLTFCHVCGLFFKATLRDCPNCGAKNDMKVKRGNGIKMFEQRLFNAKMVEQERRKLAKAEAARLLEEKKAEEARQLREEYLPVRAHFNDTLAGAAAKKLSAELADALKTKLTPPVFNAFFQKNRDRLSDLPFYLVNGKKGSAAAIYEKNK